MPCELSLLTWLLSMLLGRATVCWKPQTEYDFFMLVLRLGPAAWIFRQAPWLKAVLRAMPESIVRIVSAPMSNVIDMQRVSKLLSYALPK